MGALADDALADSGNAIEDDRSVAALHVVQGRVGDGTGDGQSKTDLTDSGKNLSHFLKLKFINYSQYEEHLN